MSMMVALLSSTTVMSGRSQDVGDTRHMLVEEDSAMLDPLPKSVVLYYVTLVANGDHVGITVVQDMRKCPLGMGAPPAG